jgi:deoxyribose-phosphate aldolase
VLQIGLLRAGLHEAVEADIRAVVEAARRTSTKQRTLVKVILETAMLAPDQIETGCRLAERAGADFVKTCTGFGGGGATVEDVARMRRIVGDRLGVKASGGIRDRAKARALLAAGATRLGCSSGLAIIGAAGA